MRADLKAAWIAALRSGNYQQGLDRLHSAGTGSYCCLGVLCEILATGNFIGPVEFTADISVNKRLRYQGQPSLFALTDNVLDAVGMSDGEQQQLMRMNDGEARTFEEIAQWIEECM